MFVIRRHRVLKHTINGEVIYRKGSVLSTNKKRTEKDNSQFVRAQSHASYDSHLSCYDLPNFQTARVGVNDLHERHSDIQHETVEFRGI